MTPVKGKVGVPAEKPGSSQTVKEGSHLTLRNPLKSPP